MGYPEGIGDLLLRVFPAAAEPEAHGHNDPFPFLKRVDGSVETAALILAIKVALYILRLAAEDIGEQQLVAVPIDIQRLEIGHLSLGWIRLTQIHEYLVLNAA